MKDHSYSTHHSLHEAITLLENSISIMRTKRTCRIELQTKIFSQQRTKEESQDQQAWAAAERPLGLQCQKRCHAPSNAKQVRWCCVRHGSNVSLKFIFGNPHIARCLEKRVYPGVSVLGHWVDQCFYQSWAKGEL